MGSGSPTAFLLAYPWLWLSLRWRDALCHIQVVIIGVRWWGNPAHQVRAFLLDLCPESLVFAMSGVGIAEGMLIRWLFLWHTPAPLLAGIYAVLCILCVRWSLPGAAGRPVCSIKTLVIALKLFAVWPEPRFAPAWTAFALHQRTALPAWMLRAALLSVVRCARVAFKIVCLSPPAREIASLIVTVVIAITISGALIGIARCVAPLECGPLIGIARRVVALKCGSLVGITRRLAVAECGSCIVPAGSVLRATAILPIKAGIACVARI
jgi:hypothetical protein